MYNYIEMKKGVNYIGVGIGAVIINLEGKMFLSKRGQKAQNEKGKWELPGGAMEFGDSFEETIKREVKEEFSIDIDILDNLDPFNHLIPEEKQHWVALCFICKIKGGIPKILEHHKIEKIGWFTIEEAEKLDLTLPAKHNLMQLKEKYPQGLREV